MSDNRKRPTINDQQLSLQMQGVSDIYSKMQIELFDSMIKRLIERGAADLQVNPYIWQLEKLNEMHMLNEENLKIIVERTGIAEELLREVIANEGLKVYKDTQEQLEDDLKRSRSGVVRNGVTDSLEAYTAQAISDLNLINSTLPESIQAVYKSIVEQTVAQVVAGTMTSDQALKKTIMQWQKKNFTGFTDAAGRDWRADSYARAIIKTTTYKVYNEMRTRPAEEMGVDTFYYSMKRTARPACSPLQGQIVTKGQGRTEKGIIVHSLLDYGLGTAGGCLGVHCGHYLTPFIIGVNELPELPDYLQDLTPDQAEENARVEAKQRALERTIRHHKERLHYSKTMGDDELALYENLQVRKNQGKLKNLIDSHDFLVRDYSRERLFATERGLSELKAKRKTDFQKEYDTMRNLLGAKAPKTFEDYKDIRYNSGEDYHHLKSAVRDKKLQLRLTSGEYNLKINGQQNKHILGHHDYISGRSYLLEHIDPQELVNKYAGTGEIQRDRKGNWHRNQEKVSVSDFIGVNINSNTGQLEYTRTFKIIYSQKKGTHVVPVYDEGG